MDRQVSLESKPREERLCMRDVVNEPRRDLQERRGCDEGHAGSMNLTVMLRRAQSSEMVCPLGW